MGVPASTQVEVLQQHIDDEVPDQGAGGISLLDARVCVDWGGSPPGAHYLEFVAGMEVL